MRPVYQTSLYALTLAAAAVGAYFLAEKATEELEARTGSAIRGALSKNDIGWAWVEIDGMLARLHGPAPDEAARFRALAIAGEVLNPLNLRDEMTVELPRATTDTAFRLEILRNGDSILVHGLAPEDGIPELAVRSSSEDGEIELLDLVARSSDPLPPNWEETVALASEVVAALETVRVIATPEHLEVDGIAPDRITALGLEQRLGSAPVPTDIAIMLPRPVLSPFMTRFTLDEAGGRLETCAAESEIGLTKIQAAAKVAGSTEDTACTIALGAPDPAWSDTVTRAINLLDILGHGTVTLSDLSISFNLSPEAAGHTDYDLYMSDFEEALPEIYELSVSRRDGDGAGGADDLRLTATRSPEGLVHIRGPVGPLDSRTIVETLAQARFGADHLHTSLKPATALPGDWPVQVMAAVDALAALDTGAVTLTPSMITVRGSTGNPDTEEAIARGLTETFGADLAYSFDIEYKEALDPLIIAQGPTPEDCVAQINGVLEENDVSFAPGSVEIDAAGLDTVGTIANILRDCAEVAMEIEGHTDSQGRKEMNQSLSQARADAVLNALMARRVLTGNLTAAGYGETQPIADNSTAEGREANRRIRFSLADNSAAEIEVSDDNTTAEAENDG
ncbi:MAG: OmpA family protein [Pseudomonadota bacterium]